MLREYPPNGSSLLTTVQLGKSQAELDFVDIPLDTDIPLFVDPYALSITKDPWLSECSNLVVAFFQLLIDTIRAGNTPRSMEMLAHLGEPNDTHLGLSRGRSAGRGVGRYQSADLYKVLSGSKAVQSGKLQDLSDCELHIPNISSDKISDITINIIRGKLVDYTELQCELLGVPVQRIASGMYWDDAAQHCNPPPAPNSPAPAATAPITPADTQNP